MLSSLGPAANTADESGFSYILFPGADNIEEQCWRKCFFPVLSVSVLNPAVWEADELYRLHCK